MTGLDKIIKCRDIMMATKRPYVKTIDPPVATYNCESWNIRKDVFP